MDLLRSLNDIERYQYYEARASACLSLDFSGKRCRLVESGHGRHARGIAGLGLSKACLKRALLYYRYASTMVLKRKPGVAWIENEACKSSLSSSYSDHCQRT